MRLRWFSLRRLVAIAAAAVVLAGSGRASAEVRALWVVRTTLVSPAAIDALVDAARAGGFNTLLIQVRGRGDAYYLGSEEPRAAPLADQPASFDPLAYALERARAAGIRVHAWVNVNLVSSVTLLPEDGSHVIYRHPEWLMVPKALSAELHAHHHGETAYLNRLVEYTRARTSDLEGLYLSPLAAESAAYTTRIVAQLAERYPVDGVHLDYVRFPAEDFDHSPAGLLAFRETLAREIDAQALRLLDEHAAADPSAYADAFPAEWLAFRQSRLTRLVTGIRDAVKAVRPSALLTAAVLPDAADALNRRMQDWPGWLAAGLLDAICPMIYTTDADVYARQAAAATTLAAGRPVWAGVGAYRLDHDGIVTHVRTARRTGAEGVVLFSYDSLAAAPGGPSSVADVGRAAFAP